MNRQLDAAQAPRGITKPHGDAELLVLGDIRRQGNRDHSEALAFRVNESLPSLLERIQIRTEIHAQGRNGRASADSGALRPAVLQKIDEGLRAYELLDHRIENGGAGL